MLIELRSAVEVRGNTAANGAFAVLDSDIVREIQPCAENKNGGQLVPDSDHYQFPLLTLILAHRDLSEIGLTVTNVPGDG